MAKRHDVFPSKYLAAADLNGEPFVVTIARAPLETLKGRGGAEETKTVLHFRGARKTMPLNRTNWDAVADICGEDDSDAWSGHKIELYPSTTQFGSETVPCIRIRAPGSAAPKPKTKAEPAPVVPTGESGDDAYDDMADEIPF